MKKFLFLLAILPMFLVGCSKAENKDSSQNDSIKIDSIEVNKFNELVKRISDPGELIEIKQYKIGTLKTLNFGVDKYKFFKSNEEIIALNIQMKYETEYYYRTGQSLVLKDEVEPLMEAISAIKDKYLNSKPSEPTIAAYITNGKFTINSKYTDKWETNLMIDINNKDAIIKIGDSDIIELLSLLEKANLKAKELSDGITMR